MSNHTITGTLLGLNIENPLILAPIAFGSHFILDSLPHFGHPGLDFYKLNGRIVAAIDSAVSLATYITVISIWPEHFFPITLGVFAATLPDLLYIPRYFWNIVPFRRLMAFHHAIQWSETPPGMVTEGVWAAAMIYLLRSKL